MNSSNTYHAIVLTVPSCLTTIGGVVQARRRGLASGWTDLTIVGGVVGVPLLTVFVSYVVGAVSVGLSFGLGGSLQNPAAVALGLVYFTFLALVFGLVFAVGIAVVVFLAVGAGSVVGYVSTRAAIRLWKSTPTRG